jgi:hypothetical protein
MLIKHKKYLSNNVFHDPYKNQYSQISEGVSYTILSNVKDGMSAS